MSCVYATLAEYRVYFEDVDAEVASRIFANASRSIDRAIISAVYDTNVDGCPTDLGVAAILREACLEQAFALVKLAGQTEAETSNPLGMPLQSAAIDGVSWTSDTQALSRRPYYIPAPGYLCNEAMLALGGLRREVWAYG